MDGGRSILVGHGQAPVRMGLRELLSRSTFEIVGEAADAAGAIEMAFCERPDLCLLDVNLPGGGIQAARQISRHLPETAVVMLSDSSDSKDLLDALRAGAVGYLPGNLDPRRLPQALDGVLAGEAAVPRGLVLGLIEALRSQGRHRAVLRGTHRTELTRREWEVLELMHQGVTTREAAERLLVSPITVRRHMSKIVRKLDAADRGAAIRMLDGEPSGA